MSEILHGNEPLGARVRSVKPLPDYKLSLEFSDGTHRLYDAHDLLKYPAYRNLKDEAFFALAYVDYGTVCWPGDIDCCPDRLYQESKPK